MKRRILSILLAAAMIFSLIPTAFATEQNQNGQKTINYVSLGDSMANGYGLDDNYEHFGYKSYCTDCYPNQFANWLSETTGLDYGSVGQLIVRMMEAGSDEE